jgi:hypothetical protein
MFQKSFRITGASGRHHARPAPESLAYVSRIYLAHSTVSGIVFLLAFCMGLRDKRWTITITSQP